VVGAAEQSGGFEFADHSRAHHGVEPFDLREFAYAEAGVSSDRGQQCGLRTGETFLGGEQPHASGDASDGDAETVDVVGVEAGYGIGQVDHLVKMKLIAC